MDIKDLGLAAKELIHHRIALDQVKVRQVYDSGAEFFIVTSVEYSTNMVFVTGDIINDDEMKRDVKLGRSAMLALYPTKYLEDVTENHVWGAFYSKKVAKRPEEF